MGFAIPFHVDHAHIKLRPRGRERRGVGVLNAADDMTSSRQSEGQAGVAIFGSFDQEHLGACVHFSVIVPSTKRAFTIPDWGL